MDASPTHRQLHRPAGTVDDSIAKANATIVVTGYSVTYDGLPHTATGTATGVAAELLAGLDLSATTHTDAGTYALDAWTFTDVTGNYNNSLGTVADYIGKADAVCTIDGYNVTYDGLPHTATGACHGRRWRPRSPGSTCRARPTPTPATTSPTRGRFTDPAGNYNDQRHGR